LDQETKPANFHEQVKHMYEGKPHQLEELPQLPEDDLSDDEVDRRYGEWRRAAELFRTTDASDVEHS
jgi:hypothetical protein